MASMAFSTYLGDQASLTVVRACGLSGCRTHTVIEINATKNVC